MRILSYLANLAFFFVLLYLLFFGEGEPMLPSFIAGLAFPLLNIYVIWSAGKQDSKSLLGLYLLRKRLEQEQKIAALTKHLE